MTVTLRPVSPRTCRRCGARAVGTVASRPSVVVYACGTWGDERVVRCLAIPAWAATLRSKPEGTK